MEKLREYNKKLLYNILPDHVAQHFLAQQAKKNDVSFFFNHIIRNTKYSMYFNVIWLWTMNNQLVRVEFQYLLMPRTGLQAQFLKKLPFNFSCRKVAIENFAHLPSPPSKKKQNKKKQNKMKPILIGGYFILASRNLFGELKSMWL